MSEQTNSKTNSQPIINLINNTNQFPNIIPSYMRNINSLIITQQEISKISWEKEGNEVIIFKFLANKQRKNFFNNRRKKNNKVINSERSAEK